MVSSTGPMKNLSILLVEDNGFERSAISDFLLSRGMTVDTVSNGQEALNITRGNGYDLVITDILMPEMDGIELCKRIREKEDYGEKPIVFLTAKSREEDKVQCIEAGANLSLSKPISPDKLLDIISDTLG